MTELAQHMCNPMTDYVKSLEAETIVGGLNRLVGSVEEMVGVLKDGQIKYEEATRKVKIEDERKMEALRRLKVADEKRKAMKEFVGSLLEAKKRSKEPFTPQKMGDRGQMFAVDEALVTMGFGKFQGLVLANTGMGWVAEAMVMMLLYFVGPAVQAEWGLSLKRNYFRSYMC